MKVIKNINNNVSVCIDEDGNELIAFGKGIGFKTPPYEVHDLGIINRTYYDIDHRYLDLISQIPEPIFELSSKIVLFAENRIMDVNFNSNLVFTLADHLHFAIKRFEDHMKMKFIFHSDLLYLHDKEVQVGTYALEIIRDKLNIELPEDEKFSIAMHIINSECIHKDDNKQKVNQEVIEEITKIIEKRTNHTVNRAGFNYSRFSSHMEYLLKRSSEGKQFFSDNTQIFVSLKEEFPEIYKIAEEIVNYFKQKFTYILNEEEILYLILHINRLCAREDCYQ